MYNCKGKHVWMNKGDRKECLMCGKIEKLDADQMDAFKL